MLLPFEVLHLANGTTCTIGPDPDAHTFVIEFDKPTTALNLDIAEVMAIIEAIQHTEAFLQQLITRTTPNPNPQN